MADYLLLLYIIITSLKDFDHVHDVVPPTDIQPGAVFTRDTWYTDGRGTLSLHA